MELAYCIDAAEEFGRIIWPYRKDISILDLMLFGSTADKKQNPSDVDVLIIHTSPKLDRFYERDKKKEFKSSSEALKALDSIFGLNLPKLFKSTKVEYLIERGLFHTAYIQDRYFRDTAYKINWDELNENPNFLKNIISQGVLCNPKTEKYDIKASTKYRI